MTDLKICVIGLGNVGLDLAINFSKKFHTIGYDINKSLIEKIKNQKSKHLKISKNGVGLEVSCNHKLIVNCNVYIITVPSPVNKKKLPDLDNIIELTKLISKFIRIGNILIYESTFYPGLTEEIFIPIIERESKLKLNKDFYVGYSPERINIGKNKRLSNEIVKITSGSNKKASKIIDSLYKRIIKAGTYNVESIRIAEAVKILENCQRDLNIAFMNEITKFFNKLNLDTKKVIEAASTKWNFFQFYPGLVGGDCIAVDPYYLIFSAKKIKHDLPLVRLARETNEGMVDYIYKHITKAISNLKISALAFFGISYKENCKQINNSMYLRIIQKLEKNYKVDIYDHFVEKAQPESNFVRTMECANKKYDVIIIGSKHDEYKKMNFKKFLNKFGTIIDIHGISMYPKNKIL